MTWAQRLKRVFNIDVETCAQCGGSVKVIACIEDQVVIDKILLHLEKNGELPSTPDTLPETRAPINPRQGRFSGIVCGEIDGAKSMVGSVSIESHMAPLGMTALGTKPTLSDEI